MWFVKRRAVRSDAAPAGKPEPLTDAEREAVERGEADAAAGRVVPQERVRRWLLSWGKPAELPAPRWRK
jgi:predicted transcriptional regulator